MHGSGKTSALHMPAVFSSMHANGADERGPGRVLILRAISNLNSCSNLATVVKFR